MGKVSVTWGHLQIYFKFYFYGSVIPFVHVYANVSTQFLFISAGLDENPQKVPS